MAFAKLLRVYLAAVSCRYAVAQLAKQDHCQPLTDLESPHTGRRVSVAEGITGVGVYFLENGGTEARYPCQFVTGLQSCERSSGFLAVAIGAVLSGLAKEPTQDAVGVPLLARRGEERTEHVEGLLKYMDITYDRVYSDGPHNARRSQVSWPNILTIDGLKIHDSSMNIEIEGHANSTGRIFLDTSLRNGRRDDSGSHEAGIKLTYTTYPGNLTTESISASVAAELAQGMATDWAEGAQQDQKTIYFGIFQQQFKAIVALEIIPQNAGYGLEWEDPNFPCGDLTKFACPAQYKDMCPSSLAPVSTMTDRPISATIRPDNASANMPRMSAASDSLENLQTLQSQAPSEASRPSQITTSKTKAVSDAEAALPTATVPSNPKYPTDSSLPPIDTSKVSCTVVADHRWSPKSGSMQWSVQIGRPVIEKKGCDPVQETLKKATKSGILPDSFECENDSHGQTMLDFISTFGLVDGPTYDQQHANVVRGLETSYPGVLFKDDVCKKPALP